MSTFKTAGATWSEAALLILPMALGAIHCGAYNAAATGKYWLVTKWALNRTVQNSVAVCAEDAPARQPPEPANTNREAGAAHESDNLSHGADGYPHPLTKAAAPGLQAARRLLLIGAIRYG